jgi:hypothetical protein
MAEQPAPAPRRSKREGKKKNNDDEIDPEEIDTSPLKVGSAIYIMDDDASYCAILT